jgi:signal peptidase II
MAPLGLVALAIVLLDHATKILVAARMTPGSVTPLLGDTLRLVYVRNSGGAFGLLRDSGTPFVFISIAASVLVFLYLYLVPPHRVLGRWALAVILGGALGNMIDRVFRSGEVIDFIEMGIGSKLRWPAYNVADIAVTVGVALLVIEFLWDTGRNKEESSP